MSLFVLEEGARRTAAAWRADLGLNAMDWEGLVSDGVFSPVRGDRDRAMRLNFVGLVGLDDRLLACMPRFGMPAADAVSWLRRVLAAYFTREGRRSRDDAMLDLHYRNDSVFREIDALGTLLGAFAERGLYRRSAASTTQRGSGGVDWATTLARCAPLVAGGQPLYLEPYRQERRATTNEVSHLQAAATAWLAHRYRAELPTGLADAVAGVDLDSRMSPERAEFDLALLGRERAVTYLAADLRLLDALEAVVSGRRRMDGIAAARLHGTTAFALVWEDALRDLFGDDSSDASLGVANWYDLQAGVWSDPREAPARRLDLLLRHGGDLIVLDAKYHHPYPASRPGWSDIVKQIYYAESIVRDPEEKLLNAFLLPMSGRRLALVGRVRVEEAARAFPAVEAWTVDPAWVFSGYGDADPTRRSRARAAFLVARNEMAEVLGDA